MYSNVISR